MRAPDLEAIAAQHAAVSGVTKRNAWLHRLIAHMGRLPTNEEVRFRDLLDHVKITGPTDFNQQDAITMATHLRDMHDEKWPFTTMYAYRICLCINEVMMDIEG